MIRTRFVAPANGELLVTGARVALANALFARNKNGQFTLRMPGGDNRAVNELRWLGINWDAIGQPGDYAGAIEHLKRTDRLYPCFESETELRARREHRIRRGRSPVYDRAMLKLTQAQRDAAEAGGKSPHWRFRLSSRTLAWNDAISGRRDVKLPSVSDPVLVAANGNPAAALTAVVDDIAEEISHVIGAGEGDGVTGTQIDLLDALGYNAAQVTFTQLPPLGDTGRLAIRDFRHDGIDAEALTDWLGGGAGFALGNLAGKPDPAALPSLNRTVLSRGTFAKVMDRLPPGVTEPFWLAIRGHIDLLTEARHWWDVVNGTIFPPIPAGSARLIDQARAALPEEPWNEQTWATWLAAIPEGTRTNNAGRLRLILTGDDQGPEIATLLPLMGRRRVLERLRGG